MIKLRLKQWRRKLPHLVWRWLQIRAEKRLSRDQELWAILTNYLSATRSTGCAYSDYLELYNYVRKQKPREILECGTGVSTIILGQALRENECDFGIKGRLTSMEELPEFHTLAQKLLPLELLPYVEIKFSSTTEDNFMFIRGMRYRDVPERDYDFIFIDGPQPKTPSDGTVSCDFDFIHQVLCAKNNRPISAIIDRRITTCYALQSLFGPDKVHYDYVRELGFIGPCRHSDLMDDRKIAARLAVPRPFRRQWFFVNKFNKSLTENN
ncbi:MAG: hypothetical protein AAB677_01580 [Patescibacteria group bacterium]